MDSLVSVAVGQSGLADPQFDDLPIESVALSVSADESHPEGPRIVFEAAVVRDSEFSGEPSLEVRFVSNVAFEDEPPGASHGFSSGVRFDD